MSGTAGGAEGKRDTGDALSAGSVVWLNGNFVPLEDARISPMDRGFLYGDGLFETIRAQDGQSLLLARHVERLNAGLAGLRIGLDGVAESAWAPIIAELLLKNGLARGIASVKAVVSRGVARGIGLPEARRPTVLLTAEAYQPPVTAYDNGWLLHQTSAGSPTPNARHKTLNYLRLLDARQEALDAGADEALLVDSEGWVVETAAGSILALTRDGWVRPSHAGQLAGITVEATARMLAARGFGVTSRSMSVNELRTCRAVWVLNSLVGIVPVRGIGGTGLPELQAQLAADLRAELFGPDEQRKSI